VTPFAKVAAAINFYPNSIVNVNDLFLPSGGGIAPHSIIDGWGRHWVDL
jgi:hypothetical protein